MRQLIETQQQETGRHFPDHQREIPRDWVIKETEIQMTTEKLRRGEWGAVFKGKFRGCDVAVKEMFDEIYSSYNRHLFEREVDIASKCRHPCLLQFIGATIQNERPLLVTEIMECSLRTRLNNTREPPLSEREICVICLDVARALNYLHQKEPPMIHRDISSGNELLWRQGYQWRGKVSDHGTANIVRQSTITCARAAIYCAPEALNEAPNQSISCKVRILNSKKQARV